MDTFTPDKNEPFDEQHFKKERIVEHKIIVTKDEHFNYKVDHPKTGFAIILSHSSFEEKLALAKRSSANIDKENAEKCFSSLGFDIQSFENFTNRQILNLADAVSRWNHSDKDCIVIVISTHGDEDGLIFSYNRPYHVERMIEEFASIESLKGKPKIFIIQSCRGVSYDHGAILVTKADAACFSQNDEEIISVPLLSDCLIVYSSYDGFTSFTNDTNGSYFLTSLFKELEENAYNKDILSLIVDASKNVAFEFESFTGVAKSNYKKQMPTIHSMLTRKLQFKPKSYSLAKIENPRQSRVTLPSAEILLNYEMNHKKRGEALFFNFEIFDPKMLKYMGNGFKLDRPKDITLHENIENLKKTFLDYEFNITTHTNCKGIELTKILFDLAQEDHSDSDCLVIIISTYGHGNQLILNDTLIEPYKIVNQFFGDQCPSLIGKPKLFFVNLTNGTLPVSGISHDFISLVSSNDEQKEHNKMRKISNIDDNEVLNINEEYKKIPISADILVMYSSAFGQNMNIVQSSFLMILGEELEKNLELEEPKEILDLLTIVNKRVSWDINIDFGFNQKQTKIMPRFVSSLTRHLYLQKKN